LVVHAPKLLMGSWRKLLTAKSCSQSFSAYYVARSVIANLPFGNDPEKEQHEQARVKAAANLQRLNRSLEDQSRQDDSDAKGEKAPRVRKEELVLDQYENQIALEVVAPEDIPVGFDGELYFITYYVSTIGLTQDRYWRFRRHYRGTQGIRHLPLDYASLVLALLASSGSPVRCTPIWPSWVRENYACKGTGT
jgi:hypothetical protein